VWIPSQKQIQDFHVAKTIEDVGFYAGFVGKNRPNYWNSYF
jgi:hypothetical protein